MRAPCFSTVFVCLISTAPAATLKVGLHHPFAKPSQPIQAAKDGDTIEIDAGTYPGDVATIRANHLTIRGVGAGRAKLPAHGRDAGGKAIWVVVGSDLTVENIDYHLTGSSPCVGKGAAAGKFGDFDLMPTEQYVHPCNSEPRPAASSLDVGAFQWQK
jgi:hypothetical protein